MTPLLSVLGARQQHAPGRQHFLGRLHTQLTEQGLGVIPGVALHLIWGKPDTACVSRLNPLRISSKYWLGMRLRSASFAYKRSPLCSIRAGTMGFAGSTYGGTNKD